MTPPSPTQAEPASPPTQDADLRRHLEQFLESMPRVPLRIRIESTDGSEEAASIPAHTVRTFLKVLDQQARGRGVDVIPNDLDFTTEDAAKFLRVSPTTLDDLLDRGEIPHQVVGEDRRVRLEDLSKFRRIDEEKRFGGLAELVALDQELGFY